MNFDCLRRASLHILFWVCYYIQFTYTTFLWDRLTFREWAPAKVFHISLISGVIFCIPEVLFCYYIIYYGSLKLVRRKRNIIFNILEVIIVLLSCVLLNDLINNYFFVPYILHNEVPVRQLFDTTSAIACILYIGFALGLMLVIKYVRSQIENKEKEKHLLKEKMETELKFLRNQINPHFLLNTLNNIYSLSKKSAPETPDVIMRLSKLLSFMLYEANNSFIDLSEEINFLEDFLELETIRYNKRLMVFFEKEIDNNCYQITPLLLMPLVENAFKHGVRETTSEAYIKINISVNKGCLQFIIENSTTGCKPGEPLKNIGLLNLKRRLQLTYKDYNLDVDVHDKVFKVNLSININSYAKI